MKEKIVLKINRKVINNKYLCKSLILNYKILKKSINNFYKDKLIYIFDKIKKYTNKK